MPKPVKLDEFKIRLQDIYKGAICYLSGYTMFSEKCIFRCSPCSHEWSASPKMVLGVKRSGCPICANRKRAKSLTQKVSGYLEKITAAKPYGDQYEWMEEYANDNKRKLLIRHHSCGNLYRSRPNDFQQGYQCPFCFKSPGQYAFASFLPGTPEYDTDGIFYVLFISNDDESFLKVGITRKTIGKRIGDLRRDAKSLYSVESILVEETKLRHARDIEVSSLRELKKAGFSYSPKVPFAGHTECFDISCVDKLEEIIRNCMAVIKPL